MRIFLIVFTVIATLMSLLVGVYVFSETYVQWSDPYWAGLEGAVHAAPELVMLYYAIWVLSPILLIILISWWIVSLRKRGIGKHWIAAPAVMLLFCSLSPLPSHQ